MRQDFVLSFKSTIDKIGTDFASSQTTPLDFVDMDDTMAIQRVLKGKDTSIVWEFLTLDESPVEPLDRFSFRIGARTINDASNYGSVCLVGKLNNVFTKGSSIQLFDYTSTTPTVLQGVMHVTSVGVDP